MTPTDLLLNADFTSVSPGVFSAESILSCFGLIRAGGAAARINRLANESWSHTFDGWVQQTESRVGVLFGWDGETSNLVQSGLLVEGAATNVLGDPDWTSLTVTNGTIAWSEGPTASLLPGARGFTLTSAAAGACYVNLPGPFPAAANATCWYSLACLNVSGSLVSYGLDVDGTTFAAYESKSAWRWFQKSGLTGAAPADFRVGFTATAAGQKVAFAFPQLEVTDGTSPILGGTRAGETYLAPLESITESGRLNFEWDLIPELSYPGSTSTQIDLLYVDATNNVVLFFDPSTAKYRMGVTINGASIASDPFIWNRGTRLRLFLSCGNGPAKLAWSIGDEPAQCVSSTFVGTQDAWPTPRLVALMGRTDRRQFSSVVRALRAYRNGDRPDWVGCVCAS